MNETKGIDVDVAYESIIKFMGYERKQGKELAQYISGGNAWYIVGNNFTELEKYFAPNQNWNHLMPVWNKLWYYTQAPPMKLEREWADIRGNRCARAILYGTIEEAFTEIAAAIKWYNENIPT